MSKKSRTTEEFIQEARLKHNDCYDYCETVFVRANDKVQIKCLVHNKTFTQAARMHLSGRGCPDCGREKSVNARRHTHDLFIEKAQKVHGDFYDYSKVDYQSDAKHITIICPYHATFLQTPSHHLTGQGCPDCGSTRSTQSRFKSQGQFIIEADSVHQNVYDYSEVVYQSDKTHVRIRCLKHGSFDMIPSHHLQGQGCPKCGYEYRASRRRKTQVQFIAEAMLVHNSFYSYNDVDYQGDATYVKIGCPRHKLFKQTPNHHLSGQGCPTCSPQVSKRSSLWLDSLGVVDREWLIRIPGYRATRVDGFDPVTNTVYQFMETIIMAIRKFLILMI